MTETFRKGQGLPGTCLRGEAQALRVYGRTLLCLANQPALQVGKFEFTGKEEFVGNTLACSSCEIPKRLVEAVSSARNFVFLVDFCSVISSICSPI